MPLSAPAQEALLLLPGYELDEYPRNLESDEAACLLAGWVALWHPSLLLTIQKLPRWQQAENVPTDLASALVVTPACAKAHISAEYSDLAKAETIALFDPHPDWRENQRHVLRILEISSSAAEGGNFEPWEADFAALGYAYLQIQLMTRQLRYTSNLDQIAFEEQVLSAAAAAKAGEKERAAELLQACFDSLGQERDHYYSLDVNLLDVTLLATTTLGKSLGKQLDFLDVHPPAESESPSFSTSFLAAADVLSELGSRHPDNFGRLKQAIESKQACLIGGLDRERPHPLLSRESFVRDLQRGREAYQGLELKAPEVFGRLSFGLESDHAAELNRFGFSGVFLTAWSEGSYPEGSQAKLSWESSDGTYIAALSPPILDSSDSASFLSLGWTVGESLDHQHVPTLVFAHWPGKSCDFYELLKLVARRTPALGRFSIASTFFKETDEPYHQERLSGSSFRYNWLAKAADPAQLLRATKCFHLLQARCRTLQNLSNLAWQLEEYRAPPASELTQPSEGHEELDSQAAPTQAAPIHDETSQTEEGLAESQDTAAKDPNDSAFQEQVGEPESVIVPLAIEQWQSELGKLFDLTDSLLDDPAQAESRFDEGTQLADDLVETITGRLQKCVSSGTGSNDAAGDATRIIINPRSFPNRVRVQSEAEVGFPHESWNFASGRVGHDRFTSIDVPSMGFVIAPESREERSRGPKQQPLADTGGLLQNEFLEVQVDSARGHVRSLHVPARRGNRLSLMIARRERDAKGGFRHSEMVASRVRMLTSSNICGLVRAEGRLEMDGKTTGEFEIDYEIWRGSRIVEVVIRLDGLQPLTHDNPWKSAYISRLAWPTEAAILRTYHCDRRHAWPSGQAISPLLIEIDETDYRTHFLPGGLAFHRRTESRFMESILAVNKQNACEHRIGIAVDLPYPMHSASDFVDHRYTTTLQGQQLEPAHGWLVSADMKNVLVHLEAPLAGANGELVGVRLFLAECDGKSTNTNIRLMHDVESARRVDHHGNLVGKLTAKDDSFTIAMRSNEQCNVDVLWK